MHHKLAGLFGAFFLLSLASQVFAAKPLLIINEHHFGFNTPGPTFVVYDDGNVIYQFPNARVQYFHPRKEDPPWPAGLRYMLAKVDKPEELIERLLPADWVTLKSDYSERGWMDDVTTVIWKSGKFVRVYGEWREHIRRRENGDHLTDRMPTTLRDSLKRFEDFNPSSARLWLPEYVVLSICSAPQRLASLTPIKWPTNFPKPINVMNASTINDSIVAEVNLPGRDFPSFCELIKDGQKNTVFLIEQRMMILAGLYFEFPEQEALDRALHATLRD